MSIVGAAVYTASNAVNTGDMSNMISSMWMLDPHSAPPAATQRELLAPRGGSPGARRAQQPLRKLKNPRPPRKPQPSVKEEISKKFDRKMVQLDKRINKAMRRNDVSLLEKLAKEKSKLSKMKSILLKGKSRASKPAEESFSDDEDEQDSESENSGSDSGISKASDDEQENDEDENEDALTSPAREYPLRDRSRQTASDSETKTRQTASDSETKTRQTTSDSESKKRSVDDSATPPRAKKLPHHQLRPSDDVTTSASPPRSSCGLATLFAPSAP